ncbi:hypothetical protein T08_4978 [Trichinella sp. T8]|nr:hypothetical protein T08_4978 [Trichinella sp. T8]
MKSQLIIIVPLNDQQVSTLQCIASQFVCRVNVIYLCCGCCHIYTDRWFVTVFEQCIAERLLPLAAFGHCLYRTNEVPEFRSRHSAIRL